ncbi:starch-binding protein [Bacteroidia bacterium]|nr:starch-binding protein [Bacteroidia bacterium]
MCCVSCEDYLDTDNLTKKDTSNVPTSEADVNMLIAAAYQSVVQIAPLVNPFFFSDLVSDDRFGAAGMGDKGNRAITRLKQTGENQYQGLWDGMYRTIFRANNILASMDMVPWSSQTNREAIEGEVLFLRAYAYLNLCRAYGTVPMVTSMEPLNLPRATADELWGFIGSDLKSAIEKMPAVTHQTMDKGRLGHATKWAAQAMMARAWLFYTGYYQKESMPLAEGGSISKDQIVAWLKEIVNNSGHGLLPNFWSLWPYSNEATSKDYTYMKTIKSKYGDQITWIGETGENIETIFAHKSSSLGNLYGEGHGTQLCLYGSIRAWGQGDPVKIFPLGLGWGGGTVNSQLWEEWLQNEPNDIRRQASILDVTDKGEIEGYDWGEDRQMEETGFWNKKYIAMNAQRQNAEGKTEYVNYSCVLFNTPVEYRRDNTQDVVIIRFADVLLMLAELTKDVSYINQVRARVDLPPLATYTEDALRQERRYELCFEGIRYYDLLRWHIAGAQLNKKNGVRICNSGTWTQADLGDMEQRVKETGGFFSIPGSQVILSGGVLVQDPAWEASKSLFTD